MFKVKHIGAAVVVACVAVGSSRAENNVIVQPAAATASAAIANRAIVNTINKSGCSYALEAGDAYGPVPAHARENASGTADNIMWFTWSVAGAWAVYDLGSVREVKGIHLWNYNENPGGVNNLTNRGIKDTEITFSTDGVNYSGSLNRTFAQADGLNSYAGQFVAISGQARYVKLTVQTNHGGSGCGISEAYFVCAAPERSERFVIRPIVAQAASFFGTRTYWNTVTGTGMTAGLYTGTEIPGSWPTMNNTPDYNQWFRWGVPSVSAPIDITYDLGRDYFIRGIHLWNYNEVGEADRGIKDAVITFSSDGVNFSRAVSQTFAAAPGSASTAGEQKDLSVVVVARHVKISTTSNQGDTSGTGIGKVRFTGSYRVWPALIAIR